MNKSLNVRRCHCCGEVTMSEEEIIKCGSCKKSLLPFFYFDKRKVKELGDNTVRPESEEDKDISGFGPIRGLTAYW
jgi:hypothetical protein